MRTRSAGTHRLTRLALAIGLVAAASCRPAPQPEPDAATGHYVFPRAPLAQVPYATLPLGAIEPRGWLREELQRMARGMTGHLDEWYPTVGASNGWLGGDGDNWERGPYWLDGLVPLAYVLNDQRLIDKARPYVEWTLASQRPDGYFGPLPEPEGTEDAPQQQRRRRADWWPRMIMLKVLQSHHEATGDERVLDLMTRYFRYQLRTLGEKPLDHWSGWGKARGGENQASIYWLYNRTGDGFLLELAPLVFAQTSDWTNDFLAGKTAEEYWRTHVVNVAMGVRQPAVQYLQTKDPKYLEAVRRGIAALMEKHGQASGMFSGDELLHGTDPTHGTELCAVVELMYSLETLMTITGDVDFIDRLEKVAYNALPTQVTDDYTGRQYFQQVNQVRIRLADHHFFDNYQDALCYGLLTGYPCCTTNLHQGWPRFTRHLWLASRDRGLAALVYAPSVVTAKVGRSGTEVTIREETDYPFRNEVRFVVATQEPATFPLDLRIPAWAEGAKIQINGTDEEPPAAGQLVRLEREWRSGDTVLLQLPMPIRLSRWHERSVAVERGPLVFALRVEEEWHEEKALQAGTNSPYHWEVDPQSAWNYGLLFDPRDLASHFKVVETEIPAYPWTPEEVPVKILAQGVLLPAWHEYNASAGPLPPSPVAADPSSVEELTLIPYGASTLRIAAFPEVRQ